MDPLEEAPWADTPPQSSTSVTTALDDDAAISSSTASNKPTSLTPSSAMSSSGGRSSRVTPRRLVAQPTRLQVVEDDPLGPLGSAGSTSVQAGGNATSLGGLESPPMPPSKELSLPLRTTIPTKPGGIARGPPDPHRIVDDDADNNYGRAPRAPPPVAAAQLSPIRTSSRPSVSVEQAAKPTFSITVGDPHKVGGATGVVVPPPPEKQAMGRFESNFVESRRAALEKMLNKAAAHPTLQHDGDLKLFLESEAFNVDVKHKERKEPNLGESKGIMSSLGINVGGGVKFVEQDDWFHDRKIYLDALDNQLKALLKAMDTMVNQRKAMAEAAGEFAASLHALSTVELSPGLSGPLEALSDLQVTIRDVYDRQAQQDVLTFGITIDEYIRLIGSIKQAFSQRQKAFYSWHTADAELQKRKSSQDKLLRQGKSQQDRLNQINAEVADAEKKVHQARLLFEDMGRLMRNELDRFEKEKVEDFKSGVETFLESSVEAQKELIEKWETFLMQLDAEDDEAVFYRPPVFHPNSKPAGDTAVDRARARIDEDSD
ncbi:hypothetical protein SPBR_08246 [Sporothrix brasiliensis 5110]|uniref:Uncharacterized protein n=1 Tax=Sporothrix brasiliensis 5110 TaxID=1398154 RepID=A0A0C2ELM5_9PEZI|nr:uncharacterized protein SPBR_08246 [Sporothrix brasiliensis 5110]KIH87014.1 hypothetical protein SPBR_08246 [Sporothrix brasiliensis 5110]